MHEFSESLKQAQLASLLLIEGEVEAAPATDGERCAYLPQPLQEWLIASSICALITVYLSVKDSLEIVLLQQLQLLWVIMLPIVARTVWL